MSDLTQEQIFVLRKRYEENIGIQTKLLELLNEGLAKLQDQCPHPKTQTIVTEGKAKIECIDCGRPFKHSHGGHKMD